MPEPKHITHQYRDPAKAFSQRLAGMTKKQRARRERILQAQLYNNRVNMLARMMVNWFIADEKGETERLEQIQTDMPKLLKTFTDAVVEKIKTAAETAYEAYVLDEQNKRIMAEFKPIEVRDGPIKPVPVPVPYTQEELDALAAAGE